MRSAKTSNHPNSEIPKEMKATAEKTGIELAARGPLASRHPRAILLLSAAAFASFGGAPVRVAGIERIEVSK